MSTLRKASLAFRNLLKPPKASAGFGLEKESDTTKIFAALALVEQLFPDYVVMLCNRSHPNLQYVSANSLDLLGIDHKKFTMVGVEEFFKLVHPDDVGGLQECFTFMTSATQYEPVAHRFMLRYRFRRGKAYIVVRDEKLVIKSDNDKLIHLSIFRDVTNEEKFFHVSLNIYENKGSKPRRVFSFKPQSTSKALTARQGEIIELMLRGMSNEDMARCLNVSVNTIRNHKHALFRKVNVKSSMELINQARTVE